MRSEKNGVSYVIFFLLLCLVFLLAIITAYSISCLHISNKQKTAALNAIYNSAIEAVEASNAEIHLDKDNLNIIIGTSKTDGDTQSVRTLSEAISILQSQYDNYMANISTILGIFLTSLTLFTIAIPLFNYFFFQKDQMAKIKLDIHKVKNEIADEMKRLENSIDQVKDVATAIADKDRDVKIKPISQRPSDKAQSFYVKGVLDRVKKHYQNALSNYKKAIELDPDKASYYYELGITHYYLKQYNEALIEIRRAIEIEPYNAEYHNTLGVTLHAMKRYEEALVAIRRAINLDPHNAEYRNSHGATLHAINRYEEALTEVRQAIALEPYIARYHNSSGTILHTMKRYEEALDEMGKAIQLEPNNASHHIKLGAILYTMKRYGEAQVEIRKAIGLEPDNAESHYTLGATLHAIKRYKDAFVELRKALALEPGNADFITCFGAILYRLNRYEEAINCLSAVIEKIETKDRAYMYRGLSKISLNMRNGILQHNDAIDDLEKGIMLNPDTSINYINYAEGCLMIGLLDKAEELLQKAESLDDMDPEIYHLYAVLWEKRGDADKAKEYQEKAKQLGYIEEPDI